MDRLCRAGGIGCEGSVVGGSLGLHETARYPVQTECRGLLESDKRRGCQGRQESDNQEVSWMLVQGVRPFLTLKESEDKPNRFVF